MMDYDGWRLRHCDEECYDPRNECMDCRRKEQELDEGSDFFKELAKDLYLKGNVDEKMEYLIDSLCFRFQIDVKEVKHQDSRPITQCYLPLSR